jgi:hypothetical protein
VLWAGSATTAIVLLQVNYSNQRGALFKTTIVGLVASGKLTPFSFPLASSPSTPDLNAAGLIAF